MARRILIPWVRTEPAPSAVKVLSPNHWTTREFPMIIILKPRLHSSCYNLCVFVCVCVCCSIESLCDPMDCRQLGLSVHGILQARIWEWVAIPFSRGSSQPRDWTCVFRIGRWILYHGTTWKAQQRNSQAVGERLFIINTWKLGEVSLVCRWCWWLQWIFLKIFLSSLWCVVPTSKTKRAIKQNKGRIFIELDLDCHLVDV